LSTTSRNFGIILLPDDVKLLPDGVIILPDVVKLLLDGVKLLPVKVELLPDGVKSLPVEVKLLPDGVKSLPVKVKILPDRVSLLARGLLEAVNGYPFFNQPPGQRENQTLVVNKTIFIFIPNIQPSMD
jgi:hypothetical protein